MKTTTKTVFVSESGRTFESSIDARRDELTFWLTPTFTPEEIEKIWDNQELIRSALIGLDFDS